MLQPGSGYIRFTELQISLHQKLKQEWGFEGIVVSDWDAVIDRVEGIKAGMHLEMPGKPGHLTNQEVIDRGGIAAISTKARLDQLVKEILAVVLKANDSAKKGIDQKLEEHHELARKIVSESIVLVEKQQRHAAIIAGQI